MVHVVSLLSASSIRCLSDHRSVVGFLLFACLPVLYQGNQTKNLNLTLPWRCRKLFLAVCDTGNEVLDTLVTDEYILCISSVMKSFC